MADIQSPFEWLAVPSNYQGLMLSYGVVTVSGGCAAALNSSTWLTALIGLSSAAMFQTISAPLVAHYWGMSWPWWQVIAAGWGILSVIAMRALIKAGQRVEQRVNDIVDGRIRRWLPDTPEAK